MNKETFKKEAQQKLDLLAGRIEELQKKLEPTASELKGEAKVAVEKSLVELKELHAKLQLRFDEFQQMAGAKWDEAMKGFDAVSDELIEKANVKVNWIWEKLKRFFE
jgi:arginyl-tRNA synthetase